MPDFDDLKPTEDGYDAIMEAVELGLASGQTINGKRVIRPDAPITRREFFIVLRRIGLKAILQDNG